MRRPRSPVTSSSATSSCCTTTTRSPSRTTRRSRSARTSRSGTRPTAGTSRTSTGPTAARATRRTSGHSSTPTRPRRPRPGGPASSTCARSSPGPPRTPRTPARRGSALGAEEVAATKELLGFDPEQHFAVADDVLTHTGGGRARQSHPVGWQERYDAWAAEAGERVGLYQDARPRPAGRMGKRAADVRPGREGHGHPQGIRGGVGCHRPAPP